MADRRRGDADGGEVSDGSEASDPPSDMELDEEFVRMVADKCVGWWRGVAACGNVLEEDTTACRAVRVR